MADPAQKPNALSQVHHWLVAARSSLPEKGGASLVIEHFGGDAFPLAQRLATHLTEFHDEVKEDWLCLDEALAARVLEDLPCLALLDGKGDPGNVLPFLLAIASRGRAIIEMRGAIEATLELDNTFRVALVPMGLNKPKGFHLAIDPLRFDIDCLVAVIGDASLEWMSNRERAREAKRAEVRP